MRKISTPPQSTTPKEKVFNLSGRQLDDAVYSPLNCAVVLAVRPVQDILTRVVKAVKLLPAEMAEESR